MNITKTKKQIESLAKAVLVQNGMYDYQLTIILTKNKVNHKIPFMAIRDAVCDHFSVSSDVVFFKTRIQPFCMVRQIIWFIAHVVFTYSASEIGRFTSFDHVTVLHGCKVVKTQMEVDKEYCAKVNKIIELLDIKFAGSMYVI